MTLKLYLINSVQFLTPTTSQILPGKVHTFISDFSPDIQIGRDRGLMDKTIWRWLTTTKLGRDIVQYKINH